MRIYEKDELEELIKSLQPGNNKYRFVRSPIIKDGLNLRPSSLRLATWIIKTAIYCNQRANISNPKESLRSIPNKPFGFFENRYEYIREIQEGKRWIDLTEANFETSLIEKGRFLIYWPETNLCCGGSTVTTDGFFDDDNIPPWDTWIDYFEDPSVDFGNYLIAWIPEVFLEIAENGIGANPEKCIGWADEVPNLLFNAIWSDLSFELKQHFGEV